MQTPKEQLLAVIRPLDYYRTQFPEWPGTEDVNVSCPMIHRHEKGTDNRPSLSLNPETGEFYCHGCAWKGTSVIGFHTDVHCDGNFQIALSQLFSMYLRPLIPRNTVKSFHKELAYNDKLLRALMVRRGWLPNTVKALKLGWDKRRKRVSIPIFNQANYCLDIRYHDSTYSAELVNGKRLPMLATNGQQNGDFFPFSKNINPFDVNKPEVWCVEGEPDAISAWQEGLNAVTLTGGAGSWTKASYQKLKVLEYKDVIFVKHADKAGDKAAEDFSSNIAGVDISSLKIISTPSGKDINEYFIRYAGNVEGLRQQVATAPYVIAPRKKTASLVPLAKTSDANYHGQWLNVDILVNGKHHAPYVIPQAIQFSCSGERCSVCPCKKTGSSNFYIQKDDPAILDWIYTKQEHFDKQLKTELNLPRQCDMNVKVLQYQNIQQLTTIPALTTQNSMDQSSYVMRSAYALSDSVESNQTYRIVAKPTVHPRTRESVLLVDKLSSTVDSLTSFALSQDEITELKSLLHKKKPLELLKEVSDLLSYNYTQIYDRRELHIVSDLTFHSAQRFSFAGTELRRGSLECLILGDTRCGKGQVVEGLTKFYDLGAVVSGENVSFMGLAGGLAKTSDSFAVVWGAIPLNNGRLVVIDEFSGIGPDIMGRLSRIRSEGVAEIAKGGILAKTNANTRLLWISNPRGGRDIGSFSSGVQAIVDLIPAHEDIARFDLAVVVAKGEVDIRTINKSNSIRIKSNLTPELLRKVVLWVWSRKSEHIQFTAEATQLVFDESIKLAERYSSSIPLIQGENARFKLAKLAVAVAGRCFSTYDGVSLVVKESHVSAAVKVIQWLYDKPIMGYKQFSSMESQTGDIINTEELKKLFTIFSPADRQIMIDGLMSLDKFTAREIQDLCGTDAVVARRHISLFVKCRAVKQMGAGIYAKKASFIKFLKHLKHELRNP